MKEKCSAKFNLQQEYFNVYFQRRNEGLALFQVLHLIASLSGFLLKC